ncbi:VIT1/CCC1 transporter family protein [Marinitoga litoralis]|jgi:VIT1/CCC1 family predicted Fe2+/Mn2+ transporter|uniref:VIT1/CCC1 transporter family protein n=1 Tax=Marinitoga litoralis TaxID=570855 RepID=UPI0019608C72|nr:VIT1/CCC1 transporter family protein [Marinitoga litoralis]MBM7558609.1 VIT1/CCC1 family predicted Fe2+/Mn2+ transporter [Marinitoga litoralis]
MDENIRKQLILFQKNEITEYYVYKNLSKRIKGNNGEVLDNISNDELKHYNIMKKYTNEEIKPNKFLVFWYLILSYIFGLTFALNAMEKGEEKAQINYDDIKDIIPEFNIIIEDENNHEKELLGLIDEEKIQYVSSMVLGLNDALVELTGTLAGLTFAFQNSRLVALSGLITGIAASFSMAASEYLSQRAEKEAKSPLKASIYTGIAYIITVILLVSPYFIFSNPMISLLFTIINAIIVIVFFSFFVSVVQEKTFKYYFLEMLTISFSVMIISFVIGLLARMLFNIDIL